MKITVIGLGGNSIFMEVDHFHEEGETLSAKSLFTEPGGKGYNQAIAAARLGAEVRFLGAFGHDSASNDCIELLKKENVKPLVAYKSVPCACACILTDKHGENRVTVYGGAAAMLSADDVDAFREEIENADILVLQNEVSAEANLRAIEIAKKNGVYIVFNPAPAVNVDKSLLGLADIITPNQQEAQTLFGADYKIGMEQAGVKNAVVTLGGDGAELFSEGTWHKIHSYPVVAVDTTGGGDCFNGALAYAVGCGATLKTACDFACKVASVAVSRPHAVEAMPYKHEINYKI